MFLLTFLWLKLIFLFQTFSLLINKLLSFLINWRVFHLNDLCQLFSKFINFLLSRICNIFILLWFFQSLLVFLSNKHLFLLCILNFHFFFFHNVVCFGFNTVDCLFFNVNSFNLFIVHVFSIVSLVPLVNEVLPVIKYSILRGIRIRSCNSNRYF